MNDPDEARAALERASADLLEGRIAGPLTGLRLIEVAGVKRHRLTHDNPDINATFQLRAKAINRTKPEVDSLQMKLKKETARSARLAAHNDELTVRLNAYANALLVVTDERDRLLKLLQQPSNVTAMPKRP